MGAYVDAVAAQLRDQALDCPVGASPAPVRRAGSAGSRRLHLRRLRPDRRAAPRSTPTARSGRRRCGTCAARSARPTPRRLITEGMRLSPPEPSFLDMRNAILQADVARARGLHDAIWDVFARARDGLLRLRRRRRRRDAGRGLLAAAHGRAPRAAGSPAGLTDADTGAPIANGKAAIGGLTDGPDPLAGTTGADGGYAIEGVPAHTYPSLVARRPRLRPPDARR